MFIAQILALLHTRSVNFQNRKMERQLLGGGGTIPGVVRRRSR